jgi:hypothetical protein
MSDLLMTIGEGLTVLVDYHYSPAEKGDFYTPPVPEEVELTSVCVGDIDVLDLLSQVTIEMIEQKVFDSFDKELQEPDDEYIEG